MYKLTWLRDVAIGDPWICKTFTSEGAVGAKKRVLFCLPESSDAFRSEILISLSINLLRKDRGVYEAVTA